jgi:hypothetical protein
MSRITIVLLCSGLLLLLPIPSLSNTSHLPASPISTTPAPANTDSLLSQTTFGLPQEHTIGIGTSVVTSDVFADMLIYNPGLMLSIFYNYRLTSLLGIELSAHFLEASRIDDGIYPAGQPSLSLPLVIQFEQNQRLAYSISSNISAVFTPFADVDGWSMLQGGAGLSVRSAGIMYIRNRIDPKTKQNFEIVYSRQTALGVNAHIDYWIPLGGMVDLGFRLHGQVFFAPIVVSGDSIPISTSLRRYGALPPGINDVVIGSAGLGLFLRLGF